MKALIVEDDANIVTEIQMRAERGGIIFSEVQSTGSLHDAGNIAGQMNPDFVILDLGLIDSLPQETVDSCRHLCHMFPVIILTGYDNVQFWRDTIRNGASDYLFKGAFLASGAELFLAHAMNTAYYRSRNRLHAK
jgi:two-component system response regulator YesN